MASEFYVSVKGKKQGQFKGETKGPGGSRARDRFRGVRYVSEVISPRDEASGLPTGKRQHKPIVITKEWGAASPQLFDALVKNEVLTSVVFEFVKTAPDGKEVVYYRVTLTDAAVSDFKEYLDLTEVDGDPYDGRALEDVSFTFRKIELENLEARTTAVDDWSSPA
jgi:type VI secretion system secreted protein Hcp